jgi:hypothetical protein
MIKRIPTVIVARSTNCELKMFGVSKAQNVRDILRSERKDYCALESKSTKLKE